MASVASVPDGAAATRAKDDDAIANGGGVERTPMAPAETEPSKTNGHQLSVSSPEKAVMSEELKDIFNKLIDEQGHLDMRNVTTLIWVNRTRPDIVETIVELLIENSNERRVFNGIEFYLPQLAHMIVHLDVHLPSSALEQFALVVCQQSLHVALQFNWILVAALEDYHAELPDGSRNKKANTVYFNRCAKLLQNVERIIALGAPSAAGLEELYKSGQLSRVEVDSRTIAERKKRAEKVIGSPKRGIVQSATEELKVNGWLWHKRWHKRGFPHRSIWIRRWFEVEDRVLYCYDFEHHGQNKVKRAAVLYQASVKDCDYKDTKYKHYFEVHSPMGSMRLRAEDAPAKTAWIDSLKKQAQAMPAVAHLYTHDGPSSSVTAGRGNDSPSVTTPSISTSASMAAAAAGKHKLLRPSSITEGDESFDQDEQVAGAGTGAGTKAGAGAGAGAVAGAVAGAEAGAVAGTGAVAGAGGDVVLRSAFDVVGAGGAQGGSNAAESAAAKLLASTRGERQSAMNMSTVVLQEAKRNRRFRFFSEERQFVSDLTDVCETLRFLEDRSKRNEMLEALLRKVHIPECGYLPLCRSTEPFQRVIKITVNEAKAFSTKERVPSLVTFETEQTWAPGKESTGSPPLDVASFLHFVYGFHAPMHQDHQRYSSIALRGGDNSIMEPDLLAVSEVRDGEEMPTPRRHSRNGSFRFRAGSKGLPFPNMPPVHLPGSLSTVWRDKPTAGDAAKAKESKGGKSPFRHNLSSLGSALHARASSIRNVKLPLGRQHTAKRGSGHTPGSVGGSTAAGEEKEKEGDFDGVSGAAMASAEAGDPGKPKTVGWGEGGGEAAEKVEKSAAAAVEPTPGAGVQVYTGEAKEKADEKAEEKAAEKAAQSAREKLANDSIAEDDDTGGAVLVDEAGLDRALQEPSVPRSRSRSESGFPAGLEEVSLSESNFRSTTNEEEEEELRTPVKAYGESMAMKARRIRKQSLEGGRPGWVLQRLIMKSNDDVRQEVFVMQLITFYKEVFEREGLPLWLKPYSILSTAKTTGLIEVLNQSTSLDGLKKSEGYAGSLLKHFYAVYGPKDSAAFKAAQRRFACSLAGYSVVSYLLGFKDRHNGNVMLDSDGHIVHIDFGFVLGSAPGKKFSMERAAFKFTAEYVEVLGGSDSELYEEFIDMFTKGLAAARKYATVTITMIEIMMFKSEFPCFEYMGDAALKGFKRRLMLGCKDADVIRRARRMVNKANAHWGTRLYDRFQLWSNGIMP